MHVLSVRAESTRQEKQKSRENSENTTVQCRADKSYVFQCKKNDDQSTLPVDDIERLEKAKSCPTMLL